MQSRLKKYSWIGRFVYFFLLLFFSIWALKAFDKDFRSFSWSGIEGGWGYVAAAVGLSLLNYGLRALRWWRYLKAVGHDVGFCFSLLTYLIGFAFTLSPGKIGELMRVKYSEKSGVGMRDTAAIFLVEKIQDVFAVLVLSLFLVSHWAYAILFGLFFVFAGFVIFWGMRKAGLEKYPPLRNALMHLRVVRSALNYKLLVSGLLIAVFAWGAEGVGLYVLSKITNHSLDFGSCIGIYAFSTLMGAVSFVPGGVGGTEVVMAGLFATYGVNAADTLMLVLLCRLVTLWLAVALGWLVLIICRVWTVCGVRA